MLGRQTTPKRIKGTYRRRSAGFDNFHVKKLLVSLVFSTFLPILNADLVGYWKFDEVTGSTALDDAGTNHGSLVNATYTTGLSGTALHLNGTNSFIRIHLANSKLSLTGTPYTLTWWQKWNGDNSQAYQRIISLDDGLDFSGGYSVWIYRPNAMGTTHNSGLDQNWIAEVVPAIGKWEHFALVFDGTMRRLFKNGSLASSVATSGSVKSDNDDSLLLGAIDTGASVIQHFNGDLDEVRIYNHALTAAEIADLFSTVQIEFALQPASTTASVGSRARFTAIASADGNLAGINYQWFENGSAVLGATNSTFQTDFRTTPGTFQIQVLASKGASAKLSQLAVLIVEPAAKSLLAHWDFEEESGDQAFDGARNAIGRIVNGVRTPGKHGRRALHFDGSSYVIIESPSQALDLVNTSYTLAWWQRLDFLPNGQPQRIIAKDEGADYTGGYSVHVWSDNQIQSSHNSGPAQNWSSGFVPGTNWQHFALTFDGNERRLYVNGDLSARTLTTGALRSDGDDPLVIGAISSESGLIQFFRGDLDDIRIYDYALSSEEIKAFLPPATILITQQPLDTTIGRNDSAEFSFDAVVEGGNSPLSFQWREDGVAIPGATNRTYRTGPQSLVLSKTFDVIVTSAGLESIKSVTATLRIVEASTGFLIGHWPFDELSGNLAHDVAGSNHGVLTNVGWTSGRIGPGALTFSEPSGTVKVSGGDTALSLVGTSYTLSWWQKLVPSSGRFQEIISCLDFNLPVTGYSVFWDNGTLNFQRSSSSGSEVVNSGIRASFSDWQNIAIVWDGSFHRFYVNGDLSRSVAGHGNLIARGQPDLFVGSRNGASNFLKGLLDDVRIYSYAFSQEEVRALSVPPPAPALSIRNAHAGFLKLIWVNQSTNSFRAEQSDRLGAGTIWTPIGTTPRLDSGMSILEISPPEGHRFFRLRSL